MSSFTLQIEFYQSYDKINLVKLQNLAKSNGFSNQLNSGQFVYLSCTSMTENSKSIQSVINTIFDKSLSIQQIVSSLFSVKLNISGSYSNYSNQLIQARTLLKNILQYVTEIKLSYATSLGSNDLQSIGHLCKDLTRLTSFSLECKKHINFDSPSQVEIFFSSLKPMMEQLETFEILNDNIENGYSQRIPANFPSELSKLISYSQMLKTCKLRFGYMGWIMNNRESIIPSQFLNNLVVYSNQWSNSLNCLEINLDRIAYEHKSLSFTQIKSFINQISSLIHRQTNLQKLYLNFSGFKPFDNQNISNELIYLSQGLKNITDLNLEFGGYFMLQENEWIRFLSNIGNIDKLEKLSLNIEFWKNFNNNILRGSAQCSIIKRFMENLLIKYQQTLQTLSFNTDEWNYLNSENHQNIIKTISQFQNLKSVKLLFWKSSKLSSNYLLSQLESDVASGKYNKQQDKTEVNKTSSLQMVPLSMHSAFKYEPNLQPIEIQKQTQKLQNTPQKVSNSKTITPEKVIEKKQPQTNENTPEKSKYFKTNEEQDAFIEEMKKKWLS